MKYVETANLKSDASPAELLSALHDGQLDAVAARALVQASLADDSLMQQWRSMSAISAVLAQGASVQTIGASQAAQPLQVARIHEAANDGVFRWKMVAGFAALAAVGAMVWGLVGQQAAPSGAQMAQNAASPNLVTVQASSGNGQETFVMIRDPRLDELLAAHKQFGGMSALQQPAGSLRSASLVSTRP